jgi:hypothetical protein
MFTDDDRRRLYDALERSIGHDPAAILMGHLPPASSAELATKADLAELRGELLGELGSVRKEMGELRGELKGEMGELRGELKGEMAELRGEMKELRGEMRAMFPRLVAANLASTAAFLGLAVGVASLL